jgi:hypothetical protein
MKKNKDNDLEKDDEILRVQAMEDGPKIVNGRTLRPITVLTISWMQRNEVFSGEMDPVWKAAAFTFLHSEPYSAIRSVVSDRSTFINAVDSWIEKNMTHHHETAEMSDEMSKAFDLYNSASPASQPGEGSGSGN